jgi:hypothetical protein
MAGRDVLTTRLGDKVKVEIKDKDNPHGSLPNYGYVDPNVVAHGFVWHIASGESGTKDTEQKAINAAARAIREHHARNAEAHIGIDYSGGFCDNCDQKARVIWNMHLALNEDFQALCQNCLPDPMPSLPHRFA